MDKRRQIHRGVINNRAVFVPFLLLILHLSGCGSVRINAPMKQKPEDWPMFSRVEARTGVAAVSLAPPLVLAWEHDISGGFGTGSPLIVDTFVIVGNLRGELHVINSSSGKRVGWVNLGEAIHGSPVIDAGVAFVPLSNSRESLIAFDLGDGNPRWKREYGDIEASPLLLKQNILVGNTAGEFHCVERSRGDLIWKFNLPDNAKRKGIRSSAAAAGSTVVFGADDGIVYALDTETGRLLWTYQTGASIMASPSIANDRVFVGNLGGTLSALDIRTGVPVWKFDAGAGIYASAALTDDLVLFGTTGGRFYALRADSGTVAWSTLLEGPVNSGAVVSGDVAYVGTLKKYLFGLNIKDGAIIWRYEVRGRIKTPPSIARGRMVVATDDRLVVAFQKAGQ